MYQNLYSSVLNVVRNEDTLSSCWCQYPFLQSQTVITQASARWWAISSGVLKCYGSCRIALFKFVGSRQILNLKFLSLSLPLTRTNLLIQGVAWLTGFRTPTCTILSISCLKDSFRWTGTGQQGVCLGVTLGSTWIWYGGPGKHPIPSNTFK